MYMEGFTKRGKQITNYSRPATWIYKFFFDEFINIAYIAAMATLSPLAPFNQYVGIAHSPWKVKYIKKITWLKSKIYIIIYHY
jgi:hypothetical protein